MNDLDRFESLVPDFLGELETLTDIDSPTGDPDGIRSIARELDTLARASGAETEIREDTAEFGPHLIARFMGSGRGRILLVGHMDTVYARGDAAKNPFRIEGERAYGPGVADMKGGCLLALYAAREAMEGGAPFELVTVALTPDEEVGSPASSGLLASLAAEHDAALVLEPGRVDGSVVIGRKAVGTFWVRAHGRSSHAGVAPQDGRSAVLELAEQALFLRGHGRQHPEMTLNVGAFHGGAALNTVPDFAEMGVDIRADDDEAVRAARALMNGLSPRTDGVTLEVEGDFHFPPMVPTPAVTALYEQARLEALDLGFPLPAVTTGGGSDANRIAATGKPVLDALGPVGGRAHSPEEYIEIPSIGQRGALLVRLIRHLG